MADILIRGVPEDVLDSIDSAARRAGLSRVEYLRRTLTRAATADDPPVTIQALETLASRFNDLSDPDVMAGAWS